MPVNEVGSIEKLLEDWDWAHVFGEEDDGNTTGEVMAIPPGCGVSRSPVARADVVEIVAAVNGENDGDDWVGVFRLKDGRYLIAEGGCDYTG